MSQFSENILILDKQFDPKTKRHFLNGEVVVLHCHHFSTLYTQLAIDSNETQLLADVAEETFYNMLVNYFEDYEIESIDARIDIACQYYAAIGLGKMRVNALGDDTGEVELLSAHLDSGWIRKWGKYDKPINYIACGFISALFAAVLDQDIKTFKTMEVQSVVMGAETSLFKVFK